VHETTAGATTRRKLIRIVKFSLRWRFNVRDMSIHNKAVKLARNSKADIAAGVRDE